MFKNWYYSYYNISFISFSISITMCLSSVEIYQRMSQSKSFHGNELMVLFYWGWLHLINKHSLIGSLNLFAGVARISQRSKSIQQLHSSRWSDTDCLIVLRRSIVKLEIPVCSTALVKKWRYVLPLLVTLQLLHVHL